jgi:hypothetical protein
LIKCADFTKFLALIHLPFERENIYENISEMHLPIITVKRPDSRQKVRCYFLFQDVYAALTHMSSAEDVRDKELREMNMNNSL